VEGKKEEQRKYCNLKQTGCKLRSSTRFYEPENIHVLVGLLRKSPHNFNASFLILVKLVSSGSIKLELFLNISSKRNQFHSLVILLLIQTKTPISGMNSWEQA